MCRKHQVLAQVHVSKTRVFDTVRTAAVIHAPIRWAWQPHFPVRLGAVADVPSYLRPLPPKKPQLPSLRSGRAGALQPPRMTPTTLPTAGPPDATGIYRNSMS
jgi:hypothetical protein